MVVIIFKKMENFAVLYPYVRQSIRINGGHHFKAYFFLLKAMTAAASEGGYQTDEELELCHDIEPKDAKKSQKVLNSASKSENNKKVANSEEKRSSGASVLTSTALEAAAAASAATSPSKEVLIGGDNNPSRR